MYVFINKRDLATNTFIDSVIKLFNDEMSFFDSRYQNNQQKKITLSNLHLLSNVINSKKQRQCKNGNRKYKEGKERKDNKTSAQ